MLRTKYLRRCLLLVLLALVLLPEAASCEPISFIDSIGNQVELRERPHRVVSLVPAVSEIMYAIGADEALVGITHHTVFPAKAHGKAIVGGFFAPSLKAIEDLNPDLIIVADLHD